MIFSEGIRLSLQDKIMFYYHKFLQIDVGTAIFVFIISFNILITYFHLIIKKPFDTSGEQTLHIIKGYIISSQCVWIINNDLIEVLYIFLVMKGTIETVSKGKRPATYSHSVFDLDSIIPLDPFYSIPFHYIARLIVYKSMYQCTQ